MQICDGFRHAAGRGDAEPAGAFDVLRVRMHNDANSNGIDDAADTGIPGVSLALTGADGSGHNVSASTTTGSAGSYCFNALRAGPTPSRRRRPSGFLDGKDTQGTPGTGMLTANDAFTNVVLAAGVDGRKNNFGEVLPSSLAGYVYFPT